MSSCLFLQNRKMVFIRLTGSGMKAFAWHSAYHANVNGRIAIELSCCGEKNREQVLRIFRRMETIFDECPEIRRRITRERIEAKSKKSPPVNKECPGKTI